MKYFLLIGIIGSSFVHVTLAEEEKAPQGQQLKPIVISERPTHAGLSKKQHAYKVRREEAKPPRANNKPLVTVKKRSLMDYSTILAAGGHWAIVPRGSVIHCPQHLKGKIVSKPQGKLLDWPVFLRKNYGWIHLHPVMINQAHGKTNIGEKPMKAYKSIGKIVIATSGGFPISVNPAALKPPVDETKSKKIKPADEVIHDNRQQILTKIQNEKYDNITNPNGYSRRGGSAVQK